MKKITYSIPTAIAITGILFLQNVIPAFAVEGSGEPRIANTITHMQNLASKSADRQATDLQTIIKHADTLITNRLNALNKLSTRIQNDTRLSTNEKASLSSDMQTEISGLTTLKAKIDADTDATTARADAKQIITNYYVFAVFEPKVRLLITINNLQTLATKMQSYVPQLQNLIDTYKTQGKDVTQMQTFLNDISSQLQTINTSLSTDATTVQNVSVTSNTTAKATFTQVRQDLAQIVRGDFAKIRSDFAQMRPLFKHVSNPNQSPTSSHSAMEKTTIHSSQEVSQSPNE